MSAVQGSAGRELAQWWSIEVFSSSRLTASGWRFAYEDELTEAAITNGARYYEWHDAEYGVIFEVLFPSDAEWEAFRALPAVRAALDGVPDPVGGLLIYRGRGGASGSPRPREPKPAPGSAAAEAEPRRRRVKVPRRLMYNGGSRDESRSGRNWARSPARRRSRDPRASRCGSIPSRMIRNGEVSPRLAGSAVRFGRLSAASRGQPSPRSVQDGAMTETRVMTEDLRAAIERSGYYPGLVTDAVAGALGSEPVTAFFAHHDALFDPGMEVRRHMTVLALTPTRLVYSHTDEYPAEDPQGTLRAETSTEAIKFSRVSSVSLTRVVPDPAAYVPGTTMPSEVILTIGWNVLSHVELEPAHCGDDTCEADHGYLGTITADDLTLRISEAADGEEAVRQALSFAAALSDATTSSGS